MRQIKEKNYREYTDFLKDCYKAAYSLSCDYLSVMNSRGNAKLKKQAVNSMKQNIGTIKSNVNSAEIFITEQTPDYQYNLDDLDWAGIVVAMLYKCSKNFRTLLLKITDTPENLKCEHIVKLYSFESDASEIENFEEKVKQLENKLEPLGFKNGTLELNDNHSAAVSQNSGTDIFAAGFETYNFKDSNNIPLTIREDKAQKIKNTILNASCSTEKTIYYYICGQAGIGKKTLIKRAAQLLEKNLVIINLKIIFNSYKKEWHDKFSEIVYKNAVPEDIICLDNFHILFEKDLENEENAFAVIKSLENHFKTVFVLSDEKADDSDLEKNFFWFSKQIQDLNSDENFKMWQNYMKEVKKLTDESPEGVAVKFAFTPDQIKGTIRNVKKAYLENNRKKLDKQQFCKCAYSQVISTLGEKAKLISKKYTWDDMILDSETKLRLQKVCDRVKYQHKVYNTWGMGNNLLYGKGLSMILYGNPGTGKTMAAQVIASELGLDLYKVDIARIVSKYIGETEKNLKEVFDEAKKSHVVLLFDEADSLFSKRTDIKDSHDRNANIEVSFLLQQLEDYDGITILTTNKDQNIDEAFNRRITFKIKFSTPVPGSKGSYKYEENLKLRNDLWNKFFKNGKLPLDNEMDFEYLAEHFDISGAEIKKIALSSAFLAAAQNSEKVKFKHILEAIKDITGKQSNDFGKYEYILKNYT